MRSQLAALDHNYNLGRKQAKTQDGQLRFNIAFTKRRKAWIVKKIYEEKDTEWIKELLQETVSARLGSDVIQSRKPEMSRNIASIPRPDKEELIQRHISRY